jgi:HEAT repeat protein
MAAASALPAWPRTVKLLVSGLQDRDADVRRVAATSIGEIKARAALPHLRTALDDGDPSVRFAAAQALWKMGDMSGRRVLIGVLERNQPASAGGIGSMIKDGFDSADDKLHDPNQLALLGISQASGAFLGPFSIGVTFAEQLAKDKSAPARVVAVSLLAKDHDPRSIRDLDEALDDSSWPVQAAAAKALASHPCKILISDLALLLDQKRDELKLTAATSLLRVSAAIKPDHVDGAECSMLHGARSEASLQAAAK